MACAYAQSPGAFSLPFHKRQILLRLSSAVLPTASRVRAPFSPALAHHCNRVSVSASSSKTVATIKKGKAPPRCEVFSGHPVNNVNEYIYDKMGAELHQQADHPLGIIKQVCAGRTLCYTNACMHEACCYVKQKPHPCHFLQTLWHILWHVLL